MVVAKQRFGHRCDYTWTTVLIIQWDGLPRDMADRAYKEIAEKTAVYGIERKRACGANRTKTCACQGLNIDFSGASYTFGCSWTMYHNTCKFWGSFDVHKFKLKEDSAEEGLEDICLEMTNTVHNVQIGQYDSPVQIIPLYNIQGKRPKFCFGGQFSLSRTLILHDMVSISCFHIFLGH